MGRSLLLNLADTYIRLFHRISEKSVKKGLMDYKTNKDNYILPRKLKFPRIVQCKIYNDMQVFEMPPAVGVKKTIMYIHGGGYINNFSLYHWQLLKDLSKKKGYGITAPNYPLLPKYSHKESHQKVINYYKEFCLNNDMDNIIIAGDSAGGGYVLALLQEIKQLNLPLPKKAILISPFVDTKSFNKDLIHKDSVVDYKAALLLGEAWADGVDSKSPVISPLYGDCTGLPPIQIYVGTYEVLYDQCIELYEKLKKDGNNVEIFIGEKLGHVYPLYPLSEGKKARKNMIDFIEK